MISKIITWNEIYDFVFEQLTNDSWLKTLGGVYGLPRGGLPIATLVSHALNLPIVLHEELITTNTLIVDDISDTGKQLFPFATRGLTIVTYAFHRQSIVVPHRFCIEKTCDWLIFPWEKQ
ncbi:phosphoribosyltransferase [candidate division WWE3 bacterium]|uniref:Phosphoribosyltransferase n=1 Tax=candidate division WWE3 bacterium TaxID=2053526 RepID=A0A3A4ZEN5_UNCKA|nr:MAG: phosphoribosyltransferase [candidate division WWE3 bacterium]